LSAPGVVRGVGADDPLALRIVGGGVRHLSLPLCRPLATAHGPVRSREIVLLELHAEPGARGFGEASPLAGFHVETADECARALTAALAGWRRAGTAPLEYWLAGLDADAALPPTARAAAECALLDAAARLARVPLAELLGRLAREGGSRGSGAASDMKERRVLRLSALIGEREPQAIERAVREACARGYRALKLKLAAAEDDRARLLAALRGLSPGARLRLDANGGFDVAQARVALAELDPARVEWVEQPLPAASLAPLVALRRDSAVPIALDESVVSEAEAARALEAGAADVLVIKPAACAGPRAALRIAHRAREAGVAVVFTSFLDGAVGRALAAHTAAAWDGPLRDCGLATGALLARDVAPDLERRGPLLALPRAPGLGVTPRPDRVPAPTRPDVA
jgi:L-Ala-D/L-Glu epimerase